MNCPKCETKMKCEDSRELDNVRYRRYACNKCKKRIATVEEIGDYQEVMSKLYRAFLLGRDEGSIEMLKESGLSSGASNQRWTKW